MTTDPDTSPDAVRAYFGDVIDRLHAAQLADSLDGLGRRPQVMAASVRPLAPTARAFGPAATVQFGPTEHNPDVAPYADFIAYMDSLRRGDVAVMATSAPERSGLWGELFSAAALGRGVVGMVTDGYSRDTDQILELGFPVFSAAPDRWTTAAASASSRPAPPSSAPGSW